MQKNYSGKSFNNKFLYCIISENLIHCVKIPSYFFKGLLDMYVDVPRHTAIVGTSLAFRKTQDLTLQDFSRKTLVARLARRKFTKKPSFSGQN